jgi:glycine/D-amino acid oxidase-like deaminating enzyme
LFTEELAGYLISQFKHRFTLYEQSPMDELVMQAHGAEVKIGKYVVQANKVVLCTNGFEKFTITNVGGPDIDKHFHYLVKGTVGYMAGYLEDRDKSPTAISYVGNRDAYFYMTRRPYEDEKNEKHNLVCVGGPEASLEDTSSYVKDDYLYPDEALGDIDSFLHETYVHAPKDIIKYTHQWHGLMGYTPNGVRLVGPESRNHNLFYNLGCNGVGILPSVFGSKKIADMLGGKKFPKSIFDPK